MSVLSQPAGRKSAIVMRIGLAAWLALVIAVSISPLSFKLKLHTTGPFHDFAHYMVFAITAIFLWLVANGWLKRVLAFFFAAALALTQEWAENRLYHAGFEWKDVGTDIAGLVSGFAFMLLITALMTDAKADRSRARF